jgi:hypothetical protein
MVRQRTILSITAAAVLTAVALAFVPPWAAAGAETRDSGATRTIATAWWPAAAVDRALSYIRVMPSDLSLRTDYVPRDSFRLWGVDQIMQHPERMTEVLTQAAADIFGDSSAMSARKHDTAFDLDWQRLAQFVLGPASPAESQVSSDSTADSVWAKVLPRLWSETPKARRTPSSTLVGLPDEWQRFLGAVCIAMADTGWIDTVLSNLSSEARQFVMTRVPELVQEDETDKDKTAEVLDSLQKVEDRDAKRFADLGGSIHWQWVHEHGICVVARLLRAIPMKALPADSLWPRQQAPIVSQSPFGDVVFGTTRNDHYAGNPAIIVDPGGNDIYQLDPLPAGRHRIILDYGGDDSYIAPAGNDLGAARFGWSILADFAGDDIYRAGSFSLGSGWFGIGLLFDLGGRDVYIGDTHTQGAGSFGIGLLYDAGSTNDQYSASLFAQGFGFAGGLGVLADAGGNDIYSAGGKYEDILRYRDHYVSLSQGFGYGIRPHFSGGIGLLLDRNGNDTYVADIFGQGCSYWWAFGGLLDGGGNDQYSAYQYAQGSATHMTAGCLYDVSGGDRYESKGVSQGCGHDWAVAILIDSSGNDRYIATDLSQGAGSANGIGIQIDGAGDDGYYVTSVANTQGYGNPRREYGSIGLFLDLAGSDHYEGPGHDKSVWLGSSQWGVGVDADSAWSNPTEAKQDVRR